MSISVTAFPGAFQSTSAIKPVFDKLNNKVEKHVLGRITAIAAIIHTVGSTIVDTTKGALFAVTSIIGLGRLQPVNVTAMMHLEGAGNIIPSLFAGTIGLINPDAKIKVNRLGNITFETSIFLRNLHKSAVQYSNNNKIKTFVSRELASRLISIIKIPVAIVSRVVDLVIGLIPAIGATLCLGTRQNFNSFAYRHLQILRVVGDVYQAVIEVLNPTGFYTTK